MYLGNNDLSVRETHARDSLAFAPPTFAIELAQARQLPDTGARRYRLDRGELADYLEVHPIIVANTAVAVNLPPSSGLTCKVTGREGRRSRAESGPVDRQVRFHRTLPMNSSGVTPACFKTPASVPTFSSR